MPDNSHYRDGTAAGHKGHSAAARANSAGAAAAITKDLGRRQRQVLEAWAFFGKAGAIPEQIANNLSLPVHVIRPRAGELVKRGLLFELDSRKGDLGRDVMAYSITRPEEGVRHEG